MGAADRQGLTVEERALLITTARVLLGLRGYMSIQEARDLDEALKAAE